MDIRAVASFFSGSSTAEGWQPFRYPQDGRTDEFGEVTMFRETGSTGRFLAVGLWRCLQNGLSPVYSSELGDETFLVLEGSVSITVEATGEVFNYGPGDVGSWSKNTRTAWNVVAPFKKFFVVADA